MAEQVDLTTAITNTLWKVGGLNINTGQHTASQASLSVTLYGANGEIKTHGFTGLQAWNLIKQLNTANLTVTSLEKRILNKLITDGVIAGTISGLPEA